MKHVSTLLSAICLCLMSSGALAQQKSFSIGLKAGGNLSFSKDLAAWPVRGEDKEVRPGYQAGIVANYNINPFFYLQSGVSFVSKGSIYKIVEAFGEQPSYNGIFKTSTNLSYLQIPLKFGVQKALENKSTLFADAGVYYAYGIGGTRTQKYVPGTHDGSDLPTYSDKSFSKKDGALKRQDYGLSFGAGLRCKNLVYSAELDLGLRNIARPVQLWDAPTHYGKYYNRTVALSVAYMF